MKIAIITAILKREIRMSDKELEGVMRIYLNSDDIPFCERIEKVQVLGRDQDEGQPEKSA